MVNMELIVIWGLSFAMIVLFFRGVIPQRSEKAVDRLIQRQIQIKHKEVREQNASISIQSQKPFKKLGNTLQTYFGKNTNTMSSDSSDSPNETKKLLSEAGFRESYALYLYTFSQLVGAAVGLLLGVLFLAIEPLEGTFQMFPYIVGLAIGVYIPILYVKNRRNQRVSEIRRIFPDALEMLALCNEASMTIDMALSKIARELEKKYPVISEEFLIIGIELALLDSRTKAFDGFYKRFPLDEVRSFVTTVNQAERTGTPMAQSIRALAKEMRKDSIANIQARLESLSAKLVLPLILFFFVPVIMFMFMPVMMRVDLSSF
jgi:tight adherence protein C